MNGTQLVVEPFQNMRNSINEAYVNTDRFMTKKSDKHSSILFIIHMKNKYDVLFSSSDKVFEDVIMNFFAKKPQ